MYSCSHHRDRCATVHLTYISTVRLTANGREELLLASLASGMSIFGATPAMLVLAALVAAVAVAGSVGVRTHFALLLLRFPA